MGEAELWVVSDITLMKDTQDALLEAKDAAESAARAKANFLATMSHEIRTPMNGVIGMSELLLNTNLTAAQREYAETVRTSSELLLTVVNDILDFSRLEAQRIILQRVQFSPCAVLEECALLFAPAAAAKNLSLVVDAATVTRSAVGDPTRLRQLVTNLLSNAVKFTSRGEIVLKAGTERCPDDKLMLRISIGDTGIGVSEEVQRTVFDAFAQGDASTTREFGGLGLGLAICREVVALMGGEISVESEIGRGSTFSVTLLLEASAEHAPPAENRFTGRRALLVGEGAAVGRFGGISRFLRSQLGAHERKSPKPLASPARAA